MRILNLVGFYPEIGGPFNVVKGLTKYLHQVGVQTGVYSLLPKHYDKSKLEKTPFIDELIYLECRKKGMMHNFWPSFSKEWNNLLPKMNDYDLIHIHGVFDHYAYIVYKNVKKPYILSSHGSLFEEVISRKSHIKKEIYLSLVGKRILKKAKTIHATTPYEKNRLIELGINEDSITVMPNGVDPDDFKNLPEKGKLFHKFPQLKGKKIVLFLGRINWVKGLDDLIPAFSYVIKEVKNAHLIIAGPDNENYMKEVNKWICENNLIEHVSYVGPIYGEDKLTFLQDSNIFVLPSYSEGFSMAAIEAMYMGLPVAITKNCGVRDIVENSNAGIVANKERHEIASAIIKLLKNDTLSHNMGENGRKIVTDKLLWPDIAKQMLNVYERAICRK